MNGEIITKEQQQIVDECIDKLMEHFDSARIFVTRHSGQECETASYESGGGNFYAQLGQIKEWVCMQDQFQRNQANKVDKIDET